MEKLPSQSGVIHTLPLFIIIAAIGIISFLLITSTAPFSGGLFQKLNPRSASHAQSMGTMTLQDDCKFYTDQPGTPIAFCDTFDTAHPGGRNGDLDDTRWGYARAFGAADNPFQGAVNPFPAMPVVRCQTVTPPTVLPDDDSFICGLDQPMPEANHWMEAFTNGAGSDGGIIKQPFDFTNRTGTLVFDTDAKTDGSHTWWPVVCIVDKPYLPPGGGAAKDGFCLHFGETTSQPSFITDLHQQPIGLGGMDGQIGPVVISHDYAVSNPGIVHDNSMGPAEYVTQPDHANHFEVKVTQNSVDVWASDKTDDGVNFPNFRHRFSQTGLNLAFTKGYVLFGQAHYSPGKEGVIEPMTYHWHGIGFDGPTQPTLRSYDVPDAETSSIFSTDPAEFPQSPNPIINLGYMLNSGGSSRVIGVSPWRVPFAMAPLQNVNLNGVTKAYLTFNLWFVDRSGLSPASVQYRFNGSTNPNAQWRTLDPDTGYVSMLTSGMDPASATVFSTSVTLSDLVQGKNTIEFKTTGPTIDIANISLDLEPGDVLPLASNHVITGMPSGSTMPSSMPSTTPSPTSSSSGSCPIGDLDGDCHVGIFDFNILVGNFGKTGPGLQGDLDTNGTVDIFDFNILVGNFGK